LRLVSRYGGADTSRSGLTERPGGKEIFSFAKILSSARADLPRSGSVRIGTHIANMVDTFPLKYELTTRPCAIHAARYRWVITGNGKPIQTSMSSFETPAMADADGNVALEKLIMSSMIGQRARRLRQEKGI